MNLSFDTLNSNNFNSSKSFNETNTKQDFINTIQNKATLKTEESKNKNDKEIINNTNTTSTTTPNIIKNTNNANNTLSIKNYNCHVTNKVDSFYKELDLLKTRFETEHKPINTNDFKNPQIENKNLNNIVNDLNVLISNIVLEYSQFKNKHPNKNIEKDNLKKLSNNIKESTNNNAVEETNNTDLKMIEIYKAEILCLESKLSKVSTDDYNNKLLSDLYKANKDYEESEKNLAKSKALEKTIKINLDRKYKQIFKDNNHNTAINAVSDITNVNINAFNSNNFSSQKSKCYLEYEAIMKNNENILKRIENNETRLNNLNKDLINKEKELITSNNLTKEFINKKDFIINSEENSKNKNIQTKDDLIKKIKTLEKQTINNKKRYLIDLKKYDSEIVNLKEEIEFIKQMNIKEDYNFTAINNKFNSDNITLINLKELTHVNNNNNNNNNNNTLKTFIKKTISDNNIKTITKNIPFTSNIKLKPLTNKNSSLNVETSNTTAKLTKINKIDNENKKCIIENIIDTNEFNNVLNKEANKNTTINFDNNDLSKKSSKDDNNFIKTNITKNESNTKLNTIITPNFNINTESNNLNRKKEERKKIRNNIDALEELVL